MKIQKDYFLIKIDKQSQNKKRTQAGSIYIPENFQDMQFNLQYGEVLEIGLKAALEFPEVVIGDILIFHHHVEYKPRTVGDSTYNDVHLIETLENKDEVRTVDIAHEVFGVLKTETQEIIPYKNFVFCHEHFTPATFQKSASGLYLPDAWEQSVEHMTEQLENLKDQITNLQSSKNFKNKNTQQEAEQIRSAIKQLNKEREEISRKMSKEKYMELTLLYINPQSCKDWGHELTAGDKIFAHSFALYPLDIDGVRFTLVNTNYIALIKTQNMKEFSPLHDRVLVIPDQKETKTKGGIIVPDTITSKPSKGIVAAIGNGFKGEPTTLKEKDKIIFGKNSGIEIEIEEKKYLLMRESDVYGTV